MAIAAKLDKWGKPAWIAAVVLGFVVFWPVGLATMAYLYWSGRMTFERNSWSGFGRASQWRGKCGGFRGAAFYRSSGNTAFDEYRNETLKRLEEEEQEFQDFLRKLRAAKDKSEFDQFMADRKSRPVVSTDAVQDA